MNIEPNTIIYLLRNVPLDNMYDDTIWFANAATQWTHFKTRFDTENGVAFSKYTYVRPGRGSIRVDALADDLYDINYMFFQNTNYSNRWFYAFVTSVEYVNNETTLINFEIDVMQTWMFDIELKQCFVDREHAATDQIGDNIMSEPFDIGPVVVHSVQKDTNITDARGVLIARAYQQGSN